MRASDGRGNKKQSSSRPIRKEKRRCRRAPYWRNRRGDRMETLERVNEIYRNHIRSGQGSWKLLPKDSLVVYREQKDRQQKRKRDKKSSSQQSSSYGSTLDEESCYSRDEPARTTKPRTRSESTFSSRLSCSETSMSVSHEASTTDTEDNLTQ